ncbi:hypothetical protein [Paenarthrobacter ilicis]|uniref:hypothetical protein n=1 Tax=Paenarthrobacter ilicis TaxID=43665 RepID=UPI00386803AA
MRTPKYLALTLKVLLTGALSAALIVSGTGFTNLPDLPPASASPVAAATAPEVEPVPVQSWTEQPPPAPVPSGVEATATPAPADTVIDGTTTASTVGQHTSTQTGRVPMLATVPGNANGTSNFTAVPGVGSGSWGTTGQTGGFTWNYPFPIRQAPAGKTPSLGLSYDSTRLDGLTSATNTQASVVGDGWGLSGTGAIRQEFGSCKDQLPAGTPTWDLCGNPGGQKFSITFGSRSGLIVEDPNQSDPKLKYRLQNDDGSRLEYLTGAANGTYAGDYWKLTDPEGTQYFFGVDRIPGWTSPTQNTNSTDYVPVRAANDSQPCKELLTTTSAGFCQQAYAWNLAYIVDVHDNSQAFYYTRDTNYYRTKAGTGLTHSYVRASRLARVDYGMRAGSELTAKAPMVVHFGYTGRCEQGVDCSAGNDVPNLDYNCPTDSGCTVQAPTFYTHYRLLSVMSQTLVNGTSYGNTDYWSLQHSMPNPNDVVGARPALWFKSITHSGANTTTSNSTAWVTDPATNFDGHGKKNRVWDVRSGQPTMNRIRLDWIQNSTGATTAVEYLELKEDDPRRCTDEDVDRDGIADIVPENNTKLCFPQWWIPTDPVEPERMSYFNIFPVKQITTTPSPGVDGSTPVMTRYEYNGQLVWKYAGPKIDTSTGGSKKTWSVFGGWPEVKTITGNDPVQTNNPYTLTTYFRGNDGTPANTSGAMRSVSLTTSDGAYSVRDSPWFAGRVFEKRSYRGTGGTYMTGTVNYPWNSQYPTATASAALGSVKAYYTGTGWTQTQIASGQGNGWRKTKTTNAYDSYGRVISVSDDGELGTLTDDSCTTTSYADNTALNILSLPAVTSTYSSVCGTQGVSILKSSRTLYDGSTSAVPGTGGYVTPTKADKTRVDTATAVSGANVTTWQTGPTTAYDALGRSTQAIDNSTGTPRVTTTAYSPATGPVTSTTTTNAANWQPTVTTFDAIRGNTLKTVDQNGRETSTKYDPSGREVASWDVRRPQSSNPNNPTVETSYSVSQTSPSWVKKTVMNGREQTTNSFTIYDGMGRPRQTQTQSPGSGAIITDITYNSAGNKDLVRNPYFVGSAPNGVLVTPAIAVPSSTLFDYDAYGRVTAERAMASDNNELWKTQNTYAGVDTTTTTLTSNTGFAKSPVTTVVNTDGKLQSRKLYQGSTATGAADVSSYIYDVFGNLTRMGDGYNLWIWAYDAAGRQIASEDPDAGTTTTAYDAAGRVLSRTDELNTVTKSYYDVLDRMTKQTVTPAGGSEKTLITNTYDGAGNPKGVLASSTRNNGVAFDQPVTTTFSGFDLAYTPGTTTTALPSGLTGFGSTSYTFTNTTTFTGKTNVAGTPAIAGLPAESVSNGYDTFDNPSELRAGSVYYVASGSYNRLNQLASFSQYDNNTDTGINTTGTNKVTFNWDAATGRLIDSAATNKINDNAILTTDLGTTRYTYDPAGRITEREQTYTTRLSPQTDSQCYSYDHADRIKAVWTPSATSCGASPSLTATNVPGLGGPAPYAQTYTYTAAGDRSQVKRFGSNGNLALTEDYAYPAPGTAGPHRLQSITSTPAGGAAVPRAMTWDTAGRMTSRAGQTISYTLDGRVDTTTGTSAIPTNPNPNATAGTPPAAPTGVADTTGARYYDATGGLVGITDGIGTTITLGSITAHHNTTTGAKTATKTYTFAGKVVAQRSTSGSTTKLAFIIGDSINTAQTTTLPNTTAGTEITTLIRRTDPLGLARGSNGTASGNTAFTTAPTTTAGPGSNAANAAGFGAVNGYIAGLDDTVSSLTHLGARELDPVLGIFTAPDPILNTEDHRGFTPYTYAFGNVINASDPSGLRPTCDCEQDNGGIHPGAIEGSAEELQADYLRKTAPPQLYLTNGKAPVSPFRVPSSGIPAPRSLMGEGLGKGKIRMESYYSVWSIALSWAGPGGKRQWDFQEGDPFTEDLKSSSWYKEVYDKVEASLADGTYKAGETYYRNLSGWKGAGTFVTDTGTILSGGANGESMALAYLGSHSVETSRIGQNADGSTIIKFRATNDTTLESGLRVPGIGYEPWYKYFVSTRVSAFSDATGIGTRQSQSITWTDTIR